MKKQNNSSPTEASTKSKPQAVSVQFDLPFLELILETKAEIEALSAKAGLEIVRRVLEEEATTLRELVGSRVVRLESVD